MPALKNIGSSAAYTQSNAALAHATIFTDVLAKGYVHSLPISTAWPIFSVPWATTIIDQVWAGMKKAADVLPALDKTINDVLSLVNLNQIPWLSDSAWALISLAIIGIWQGFGLTAVILLAALEAVPDALLEAASIDGAGSWSRFWLVRLPLIAPALLFVSINSFISSFQVFAQVYYMTGGGPDYGTEAWSTQQPTMRCSVGAYIGRR